jgi:ubiquinone biosynthesis protein
LEDLFLDFSRVPIASASVAQVHKAKLHDGRLVAVKVRRPDAIEICRFDLMVMNLAARLLGKIPKFSLASPELAVEQFGKAIAAQLDFRIEAENNVRFRKNFQDVPEVEFPEVFSHLSSERVLCMSHIEGTKILHARRGHFDTKKLARLGLSTLMKMIFEDGFVHADLHPGNIFVLPGNRLALLDLGLVGELDLKQKDSFAAFFRAWATQDADQIAQLLYSLAINPSRDGEVYTSFKLAIQAFMARYWGQKMSELRTGKLLLELLGLLRKHNVRMAPSFTIVNIAIAVTEGIGKQLDPELDLMTEAIPYFLAHPPQPACSSAV